MSGSMSGSCSHTCQMIGRLSGSVPATKESPLATSKAMAVSKNVAKMGRNIPPMNGM